MSRKVPSLPISSYRTREQREFYKKWLSSWESRKPIDIENEFGYLFDYMHSLIRNAKTENDLAKLETELINLQKVYPFSNWKDNGSFHSYAIEYRADSHIARKNYQEAIKILSEAYEFFIPAQVTKILSLKLYIRDDVSEQDLLFLRGVPKITSWGRENWESIIEATKSFLDEKRNDLGSVILPIWVQQSKAALGNWDPLWKYCQLFYGITDKYRTTIPYYYFDYVLPFSRSVEEISRHIENIARENRGLPKVGEGWISETELYYAIKDAFPKLKVIHHASPKWLGRQHLDIYIPAKKVALEFQGEQHDKPIAFFGGEEAFIATQKRDAKKYKLCEMNGVRLIYVRSGYSLDNVLKQIKGRATD